ncbi:alpha-N-acetylneuraminide alpha-2,8-sialyltransferase-like isoform X2 [Branchiostoma floridae x Branchiostoma belcheri]
MAKRRRCAVLLVSAGLLILVGKLYTPGPVPELALKTAGTIVWADRNLSKEVKDEFSREHGIVANTSAELKLNATGEKLTDEMRKKHRYYMWAINESVAQEKFLADQKVVQTIPTEAPGWVYERTAADLFRKRSVSSHFGNGNFLVTQENTHVNSVLTTYIYLRKQQKIKITAKQLERFPKERPFTAKQFKTCSVVGNGGILNGSGCGEEIDASEFVFRCNTAPMDEKYRKDIGNKTNLITMNPTQVLYRYNSFGQPPLKINITLPRTSEAFKEGKAEFLKDLSVYGDSYLFIEAFLYELALNRSLLAHEVLQESDSHVKNKVIFPHPNFVRSVQSYWKQQGVKGPMVSTGLLLVTISTQMCEEVHVYGFWPFHSDRNDRRLTEHYYDNILPSDAHKITDEFKQLQRLHNAGVIRLTTNACQ